MFSQNVFSARDVLVNSALNDNNAWDSQPYSQGVYSSQNSQMSSMEMFSQQKEPISSKFDQYQRSQSQTTEDEPTNYYSKYVNNTPLFPSSSNNNQSTRSIQAFIEEKKQNISMKEERDMLQTFVNLLKDYTKEVDSSFKNFQNDMENTLQAIVRNMQDGSQLIDNKVANMKQEVISILEEKNKDLHEKQELNKNISEQSGTIKALEMKAEILEKQLNEMKNKESAYADQKTKYQELEQKYFQCINQWNPSQASCLGNTPPLSQHTDLLYDFVIPPLYHNDRADTGSYTASDRLPSSSICYGFNSWQTGQIQSNDFYNPSKNNLLPIDTVVEPNFYQTNNNMVPYVSNPLSSTTLASHTSHLGYQMPSRLHHPYSKTNESTLSTNYSKDSNIVSPAAGSSGLNVSRRNSRRPKQSPMVMVRPQVRQPSPSADDEIFLCDIAQHPETSKSIESPLNSFRSTPIQNKTDSAEHNPYSGPITRYICSDGRKKGCRKEDTVKRKRSSVSMLGVSSDDSEFQEITKALQEQSRHFSKRTKSLP